MESKVLDFSLFTQGNSFERQGFAFDLLETLSQHGYVKLVNHGVPNEEVEKLWDLSKSFFKLPIQEKSSIAHVSGPNPQRGWSRIGAESSSALYQKGFLKSQGNKNLNDLKDAREHFDMGVRNDSQFSNKWLPDSSLTGFRATMEYAFNVLESVSAKIMEALEISLQLPRGTFLDKITHEKNASEFRLNHYPAMDISEFRNGLTSRIWPHFDLGVITLLFQDGVGGLEFENRDEIGTFNPVKCDSTSELIVNVSETLQRWTNNHLPAGLHRVDLPKYIGDSSEGIIPERYSIAYFCKADRDASVGPLKNFVPENTESIYKDISAIEYQKERLLSAY